jgi:hypothetical protein
VQLVVIGMATFCLLRRQASHFTKSSRLFFRAGSTMISDVTALIRFCPWRRAFAFAVPTFVLEKKLILYLGVRSCDRLQDLSPGVGKVFQPGGGNPLG